MAHLPLRLIAMKEPCINVAHILWVVNCGMHWNVRFLTFQIFFPLELELRKEMWHMLIYCEVFC